MGGLILIAVAIIWFGVTLWLARKITGWLPLEPTFIKSIVGVLAFGLIFPLPLIDEIIGKIQFDKLCREEAGVKIYGKLELGPEFFNADGTPNFIDAKDPNVNSRIKPFLDFTYPPVETIPASVPISKVRLRIQGRKDSILYLEEIRIFMDGGWLAYDKQPWLFRNSCKSSVPLNHLIKQITIQRQEKSK